jgi:spore germination protein YaaH
MLQNRSIMKRLFLLLAMVSMAVPALRADPVALFYLTSNPDSIRSFMAHSTQIDLLVPTWYQVDENGLVTGAPDSTVLKKADDDKVPLMPILAMFNKKGFHALSMNPTAQDVMNEAMIRECKLHGYIGFQFDFENIDWLDRDRLTALVKLSATALHTAGLQLSIATVPNAPGYPGQGAFAKWIYTDWRGAYDITNLATYVDLLCLMTYDQNTRWTMPGPVAGWDWTNENITLSKPYPRESSRWAFRSTAITGTPARPRMSLTPKSRSRIPPQITSAMPTPCNWQRHTTAKCSGMRTITPRISGFTATRCGNGSSSPICIPSRTAMS